MFRLGLVWHAIGPLFLSVSTYVTLGAVFFAVLVGSAIFAIGVPFTVVVIYAMSTDGVTFKVGFWCSVLAALLPFSLAWQPYGSSAPAWWAFAQLGLVAGGTVLLMAFLKAYGTVAESAQYVRVNNGVAVRPIKPGQHQMLYTPEGYFARVEVARVDKKGRPIGWLERQRIAMKIEQKESLKAAKKRRRT